MPTGLDETFKGSRRPRRPHGPWLAVKQAIQTLELADHDAVVALPIYLNCHIVLDGEPDQGRRDHLSCRHPRRRRKAAGIVPTVPQAVDISKNAS